MPYGISIRTNLTKRFQDRVVSALGSKELVGVYSAMELAAARVVLRHYQRRGFGHGDVTGRTRRAATLVRGSAGRSTRIEWQEGKGAAPVGILDLYGGKTRNFVPLRFTERMVKESAGRASAAAAAAGRRSLTQRLGGVRRKLASMPMRRVR